MRSAVFNRRVFSLASSRDECGRIAPRALAWLPVALALLVGGSARSAPPVAGTLRLPGPDQLAAGAPVAEHPLHDAAARLALARELEGWALTWSPENGGTLAGQGRLATGEAPADFAPRFVRAHAALLGMAEADLRAVDARTAGRIEHRYYRQTHRGLPIEGSRLGFAFGRDGSPLHFVAQTAPDIDLPDVRPAIDLERARARGLDGLRAPASVTWDEGELVVVARRFSGLDRDRLAWRLRCRTEDPERVWRILVDAHTGELLERESLIVSAGEPRPGPRGHDVTGHIDGWVRALTPFGEERLVDFPHQAIQAYEGQTLLGQTHTASDGAFAFAGLDLANPQALVLRAMLAGPYAAVLQGNPLAVPEMRLANPALPAAITWNDEASLRASRAAFIHVNTAHDALKRIDPAFTLLDRQVAIFSSDPSGSCNAYASLSPEAPNLHFYAAGGLCPDIAEIADVVYHEYGHLATMYVYLPEWAPGDLHEAFSDYFATTIVDTNLVGLDFRGPGTHLREMDNDYVWPREECQGEEHCEGEVLAGALWHMRQNLIGSMTDRAAAVALGDGIFHFLRYGRPMNVHECLVQALLADDDDDDLSNGTPHLAAIAAAFERHQIGDFEVRIAHAPLYDTEDPGAARVVDAALRSIYPVERDSVLLHYSVDGTTYTTAALTGAGYHYSGVIPAQPLGTTVRYYLTAVDESGRRATLPAGAPAVVLDYVVGIDATPPEVAHTPPSDPAVDEERLWLYATVSDNIGAIGSVRAQVDVTAAGGNRTTWVDLHAKDEDRRPGLFEGLLERGPWDEGTRVTYYFEARDGSSQQNQARHPEEGEFALAVRRGRAWDFESGAADLALSGDWEWGVTHLEPAPAPSGARLVGTVLDGMYNPETLSELTTAEIDLTEWAVARLEFRTWFWTEDEWDGGRLYASRDHGATWELLTPSGGYPGVIYDTESGTFAYLPAFTGEGREWRAHHVPLDPFIGGTVMIRFRHWSDTSVVRPGWYLDDIKVLEAQALVPPEALAATTGQDGWVGLSWAAPVGVNTGTDEFRGYHVYRTSDPAGEPAERLTSAPLRATEYRDTGVANGVRYRYGVTAVYASGESPLGAPAVGFPYRAALEAPSEIAFDVEGAATRADTLVIANAGNGELRVSLYLGDGADAWADLVPHHAFDGVSDEGFTLLAEDGAGAPAPDLASLSCREQNGFLAVKVTFHDSLPDPRTDFTLLALLDTDLDRATGMPAGNLGSDYFIAIGALVYQQAGVLAFLMRAMDEETQFPVALPPLLVCNAGSDSLLVGVPLALLGSPAEIGFGAQVILPEQVHGRAEVRAARLDDESAGDRLPDAREIDWLATGELSGMATPEEPFRLPLDFDFTGREPGDLAARLFVRSNDPDRAVAEVPISAHVVYLPPEGLAHWETESRASGLRLAWSPANPDSFDAFQLARWGDQQSEAAAVLVGGGRITAPDGAHYEYLDRGVESGRRYYYRLAGVTPSGETIALSPPAHPLYEPAATARLALEAPRPNPLRASTTLRLHAPEGTRWELFVVDISGRLVRQLVRPGEGVAGVQMIRWDCRDEQDRPAPQGVYYAVARAGSRVITRSMVLVR